MKDIFGRFALGAFLAVALASCGGPGVGWEGMIVGDDALISCPAAGTLRECAVRRGQVVRAGQVLFELDPWPDAGKVAEAEAVLAAAQADLAAARLGWRPARIAALGHAKSAILAAESYTSVELKRSEELYVTKVISQENLNLNQSANLFFQEAGAALQSLIDDASSGERDENILGLEARVRQAAQALAVARWYLVSKRVTAPEDATVLDTLHEPGEWVAAGEPVVRLLAPGRVRARFFVPGDAAASLKLGDRVRVGCGGTHTARVSYVSPTAEYAPPVLYNRTDRVSLVFMVEASFDPADAAGLHPGQPASVQPAP